MPVTVTVDVPVAAVALAVRVRVLEEVAGFGLKAAVTPEGRPDADRVTFPLKPLIGVTVIVLVPLFPCTTFNEVGLEAKEKLLAAGVTATLSVIVWVNVPEVPITLTSVVPVGAVALAVSVNVVAEVLDLGLNAAVTPFGNPVTENVTPPLNPLDAAMLMSVVALPPWRTVTLPGLAASAKPAGQLLTRL